MGDHPHAILFFPGGEPRKRLAEVEALAEQMVALGGDRSSVIVALGGGTYRRRGIPGGHLHARDSGDSGTHHAAGSSGRCRRRQNRCQSESGKNLIGSFHQPLAVIIDPAVLDTLPEREYRAGLFEIVKHGVIADADLFWLMRREPQRVLIARATWWIA